MIVNNNLAGLDREEEAGRWCVRLASEPLGTNQRGEFDAWLVSDPENAVAYDKALSVWYGLHSLGDAPELIGHRADALNWLRKMGRRRWMRPSSRSWAPLIAIAASFALVFLSVLLVVQNGATEYGTGLGERRTAVLEDGSRLSLDAETDLVVNFENDRRDLTLTAGRAKFDVAKDPMRPFTVAAAGRTVIATGTSFSVEVLKNDVRVIVYEGHVAVVTGKAGRDLINEVIARPNVVATRLEPGWELQALTGENKQRVANVDVSRSLSWEGGQLDFVNEPLATVAERLNRYSETKIVVDDFRVSQVAINGVFNAGDSEAFLSALDTAYPVSVRRNGANAVVKFQVR